MKVNLIFCRCAAVVVGAALVAIPIGAVSQDASLPPGARWRIGTEPALVVGSDASGFPFDNVRTAVRLSDGRIVVADGGLESRVAVFSPQGRFLHTIGRNGDGPGEFHWITSLQAGPNDSLYVFDNALQRLTVVAATGQWHRTATFRVSVGATGSDGLESVTRLSDGRWLGVGAESLLHGPPAEIVRDTVVVGLLDASLERISPVTYLPGRMTTTTLLAGRPVFRPPPFTPEVLHASWGRCFFVSNGESSAVSVYSSDGVLVTEFQGPGAERPVTSRHLQAREEEFRTQPSDRVELQRRLLYAEARPARLPFYHRMVVDEWGHLWLQEYSPPWGAGSRWYVLSQSGRPLWEVQMPKDMTVFAISADGVLGRTHGEYEVELVELFPLLERPSEAPGRLVECREPTGAMAPR